MLSSEKDRDFCFPIPDVLENDRIKLVPFIPAQHAKALKDGFNERTWNYLSYGPFMSVEQFVEEFWEKGMRPNPSSTTFTILDKTRPGEPVVAGMASYINSSDIDACTEIGFVVILPQFQQTHVTSNMVGLLMHYALDLPEQGGLGLRRVQWVCNAKNAPSLKVAERMGFRFEGVLRWARVLPPSKAIGYKAAPERKGDPRAGKGGRDSAFSACCWDDWEGGIREWVDQVMARAK
ncbi:acyl-CoA N-acyltransferase [Lentinula raphanica]|nr:acyl-CoA N-acyltransferase [Lentinula raphanica]KAJ3760913.1 acyl-CoA N-acyltransferase [Lentinula raphanica]KAJ3767493.1 acyl-CoA N-acyltransferase [Lentinula raphanica]KAJ3830395.1 acyl-CoA N-acyltransferase [Lentinula raphanica]